MGELPNLEFVKDKKTKVDIEKGQFNSWQEPTRRVLSGEVNVE
jgi:hypothetical protein